MASKLRIPPYLQNKSLADISKDGLAPETTDSILAAAGTDDSIGEDVLVPAAPYGPPATEGATPPTKEVMSKTGGLSTKPGM